VIFVDTSAWYADFVNDDENHSAAREFFLSGSSSTFFTTEYVVTDVLNLLTVRGYADRAREVAVEFFEVKLAIVEWVTRTDVERAREVFRQFSDKRWSFTDCVSYAVIERLQIKKAFAFDRHFRQFGIVEVLP
jgi:predicted nucleic acid-binding protein